MKFVFLAIGKTSEEYLKEGITIYDKRLKNYITLETKIIPDIKKTSGLSMADQQNKEGKLLLDQVLPGNLLVLLDEHGKEMNSIDFANFLQKYMLMSIKSMIFAVGGPYGFSKEVHDRANEVISLSKMTFSHQMVRLIFFEQLYRAMTILKNEPYHHQ
jgi:23S rRNA (pseudouridine1915-N3)-methyltransferase